MPRGLPQSPELSSLDVRFCIRLLPAVSRSSPGIFRTGLSSEMSFVDFVPTLSRALVKLLLEAFLESRCSLLRRPMGASSSKVSSSASSSSSLSSCYNKNDVINCAINSSRYITFAQQ